jgi:hypothetical protein
VKGGYEVRIARQRAFCPISQIDAVRTADPACTRGASTRSASSSTRTAAGTSSSRAARCSRRSSGPRRRGAAVHRRRRGADRARRVGARLRRVRRPRRRRAGPAPRVRDGLVARGGRRRRSSTPGEEITVKVLRVDEDTQKIALGLKQLTADPWTRWPRLRGGPGAHRPRHARGGVRRVRRARAGRRSAGARVHVRADGRSGGWAKSVPAGTTGRSRS